MNDCILIGLDTSSSNTGYSIYRNAVLESYGVISLASIKNPEEKFETMCTEIVKLLDMYKPMIISIELTTPTRNAVTQRTLTMILGVVYGWCLGNDCECIFYRASQWRALISHDAPKVRKDLKEWAIKKVNETYGIYVTDDIAEAILIGQARINEFDNWIKQLEEENGED